MTGRAEVSEPIREVVAASLEALAGAPVALGPGTAITEGWSAGLGRYPWIVRYPVEGPPGWGVTSVIVKTRRAHDHPRARDTVARERTALEFLRAIGSDAGPRVLAADDALGFLAMEDLGDGIALEDLLVGADPAAATDGLVALARTLARMQAATLGRAAGFYAALRADAPESGTTPALRRDRVRLAGVPFPAYWADVCRCVAEHPGLPDPSGAEGDAASVLGWMTGREAPLALSNGDLGPQNNRITGGRLRLLDFEDAHYRHVLLDAAHLRLPFYGGPCWARLPADVTRRVESAYRAELGIPEVLDDRGYATGVAAATAAWAVVRLARLPKLLDADPPHPLGFSRRGQLLDTVQVAVDAATASGTLPDLRAWFTDTVTALRARWPYLPPSQDVYPAYRERRSNRGRGVTPAAPRSVPRA